MGSREALWRSWRWGCDVIGSALACRSSRAPRDTARLRRRHPASSHHITSHHPTHQPAHKPHDGISTIDMLNVETQRRRIESATHTSPRNFVVKSCSLSPRIACVRSDAIYILRIDTPLTEYRTNHEHDHERTHRRQTDLVAGLQQHGGRRLSRVWHLRHVVRRRCDKVCLTKMSMRSGQSERERNETI